MTKGVAVVIASVLLAACGAPSDAVRIPDEQIPFPIRRSAEPPRPEAVTEPHTISFIRRGRLVGVRRDLSVSFGETEAVIRALLEGPTDGEVARGIETAIPEDTRLLTVRTVDRVAEVDLSSEFQTPGPSAEILLRVGQVVRTVVAVEGIEAVRFAVNGEPISVPTEDGPVQRPVTILDYASLLRRKS